MRRKGSTPDFIRSIQERGITETAKVFGVTERAVYRRRARLEAQGLILQSPNQAWKMPQAAYTQLAKFSFDEGPMVIYSDPHYGWREEPSDVHKAIVKLCRKLKPVVVIANGDLIDGATISNYPSSGWERRPSLFQEIAQMQERQAEIKAASPGAKLFRTVGNHDLRFDRYLVQHCEQFAGLPGTRLRDFLPDWEECWTVQVNDLFVKHRNSGGMLAGRTNLMRAGANIATGHTHQLGAFVMRGYREAPVWGIETGTASRLPIDHPNEPSPFDYTEFGPRDWTGGFPVVWFWNQKLIDCEFCRIIYNRAWYRGQEVL